VIARSAEAKALGVPMGAPWFKLQAQARQQGIVALSSNYALYADMSNRVVEVLTTFSPHMEVYSIDESFLDLSGFRGRDLSAYGQTIRVRILRWLGLPVCVGIGATKTLAKLANHIAKKDPAFDGVCELPALSPEAQHRRFADIPVGAVWGVGRQIEARLAQMKIKTVEDLRRADPEWIRCRFSVVLARTVQELNGTSCLALAETVPAKQQIMASRSFGCAVHALEDLREAIATHMTRAAEKLRSQQCEAAAVTVMIRTSPFRPDEPQYQRTVTIPLPIPTSDTGALITAAVALLRRIYRPGYAYQKAGVMLSELTPSECYPSGLFDDAVRIERRHAIMAAMDSINQRWGRGTVQPSANGADQAWRMRRGRLSPSYTTSWQGLPIVLAH